MKSKTLQYFDEDYLLNSKKLNPEQVLSFLENFRQLHGSSNVKVQSKLISMKVPENLLEAFKRRAYLEDVPYQTLIKRLMVKYLK